MKIGNVLIDGKLVLAPMAGVTDSAFRHICREMGAALTTSEMVSAKALTYGDKKTKDLRMTATEMSLACEYVIGLSLFLNGDLKKAEMTGEFEIVETPIVDNNNNENVVNEFVIA